jgi:hypothetical protein
MTEQKILEDHHIHELWAVVDAEDIREYSGRNMYGQACLGIVLREYADIWHLARDLDEELAKILGKPRFDDMGYGIVAYWPHVGLDWATIVP